MRTKTDEPITDGQARPVQIGTSVWDVYMGRKYYRFRDQGWGNPYGRNEPDCVSNYRKLFLARLKAEEHYRKITLTLRGLRLGCFCQQRLGACHAQVVAGWVNRQPLEECIEAKKYFLYRVPWLGWTPEIGEMTVGSFKEMVRHFAVAWERGDRVMPGEAFGPDSPAGEQIRRQLTSQFARRFTLMNN